MENIAALLQQTFIYNAPTWLDEMNDDESLRIDLKTKKIFHRFFYHRVK
jgi:hypothetical protein